MDRIGFMFAGQGAQYAGMGARLAAESAVAKDIFQRADKTLGYSISEICFTSPIEDLTPCAVCQPAIFTVSVACMEAYKANNNGILPSACGGLSLGEFSAACGAGVFSFEDALKLVAERGRLMDKCCRDFPGGMAAVIGAEPQVVSDTCKDADIDVANYNCPGQIVISGEKDKLEKAVASLAASGIRVVPLTVAGAYHSRLMAPAAEEFEKFLSQFEANTPQCLFVQNVIGGQVTDPLEIKNNLTRQIFSSVRWEDCARTMMAACDSLAEFGPGNVLSNFMRRIDRKYSAAPAFTNP